MTAPEGFEIGTDVNEALEFLSGAFAPFRYEGQTGISLKKHGRVAAAAVYDGFNGANVWIQAAGTPGTPWLTRAALGWVFIYPFRQMGAARLSAFVEDDNQASIRFCEHLGFVREHTLPRAGRTGQGLHLYRMFKEDCRYA